MVAWETVNKQNATPIASPSLAGSEETFAQLAKKVLMDYPEGRTSEQISLAIQETGSKGDNLSAIKPNVSAALSSHSRGGRAIFKKGPLNEEKKQLWLLTNLSNSPLMTDGLLERIFASGEPDTTAGVGAFQEHESGERQNTTSDHISVYVNRSAGENSESNEEEAPTLPDTTSAEVAQMINNVIASAGQTPSPGVLNGRITTLAVEPSQRPHLHELQQACPPLVDQLEEPSVLNPQPSVHGDGRPVSTPSPSSALVVEHGSDSAPQRNTVESEPMESVATELQTAPASQDVSLERALPLHLAAMISMHVKNFNDSRQQQSPVFQKHLLSNNHSGGDAQAALEDTVMQLGANMTLNPTLSQSVSTFDDAQQALRDARRAKAMEGHVDMAIKDSIIVQAAMNAEIDRLKQVAAELDSSTRWLQETKAQTVASIESSRRRINAFFGAQDNDGQNID